MKDILAYINKTKNYILTSSFLSTTGTNKQLTTTTLDSLAHSPLTTTAKIKIRDLCQILLTSPAIDQRCFFL